jgi:hypothetical protein
MNYHYMIWVLHLNKSGLGKYWTLTIMEHMETKEIYNFDIDLTN